MADKPERLQGGRSNRVWRAGHTVIKLYSRGSTNPLFANDWRREEASLVALSRTGMVPRLLETGEFNGHHWLAYSHIQGENWRADTGHVAQLLGRLHDQTGIPKLPLGVNGSAEIANQTQKILTLCQNRSHILEQQPSTEVAAYEKPVLIHGDPVPGNLLEHDGTLTLIDWQCPQMGDPAEDLALFLSPAMQLLYRGSQLSGEEENTFLEAYPDRRIVERLQVLKPWYHWRMAAYCQWKLEQGGERDAEAMGLELQALQSINPSAR